MPKKIVKCLMLCLMAVFTISCSTTRGGVGVEWGENNYPQPVQEEKVAHKKNGPPAHAPAHGYRAKHAYRYYPEATVYYDTGRRVYFYMEGDSWKTSVSLPYSLRVKLGGYVTVELEADTPYEYHAKHKQYKKAPPGQLKKQKKWVKKQ